ncbi:MAG: glycoside hydrolase family 3 N-terminal domain-containing protein, partial [Gemmatimonadota bacterium]|nr:glycoside hydrolase family 3 N-terminal domain-containing protein [Gemmatimonadota bacterium]
SDPPPATLSPFFLTRLLREAWGFEGLIYTEAMDMGAVVSRYGARDAAVRALEAGADVILMPPDPEGAIAAVREGRLSRQRLDASVRRLLVAKARVGLHRERDVPIDRVSEVVAARAHQAFADTAAARSLVLARDRERLVPLVEPGRRRVLSVTFARRVDLAAGRTFDRLLRPAVGRLERARLEYESPAAAYDSAAARGLEADLVLVSAYVSPLEGSGTISLPAGMGRLVERVRSAGVPVVVLSFGNPYLLDLFPEVGSYLLAWGGREVSQRAAVRALLGRAPIGGRLPISLPPHHERGEGLVRQASEVGEVGARP